MTQRDIFTPEEIVVPPRMREGIDNEAVATLVESIQRIGLQTPLSVRWSYDSDGCDIVTLVAGRHRLEAAKRLGMGLVDCVVFDCDENTARMWEIAENLHRADFTVAERAKHVAEWIRLCDLQPAQLDPIESRRADGRGHRPRSGINEAARQLGIDRKAAQRAVKIASLPEPVLEQARKERWSQSRLLNAAKPAPSVPPVRNGQEADEQAARDRLTPLLDQVEAALSDHGVAPAVLQALNHDERMFCSMLRQRLAAA
jgi:ParB family chromosome partitioning protein